MGNAINIITTIKTKHEKSPELRMVSFVLLFADGALELWYIKAKHNVCSQLLTFISADFQKWEREVETPVCQCPALTLGWTMNLCKCLYCGSFFMKIRASGPLL